MDKYDIVLDLIGHPEKYSAEKIEETLSDPETREIYNLLCKTGATFASDIDNVDVDSEWSKFSQAHNKSKFRFLWSGSRAASIAVIVFTSLAAVAIGITVAVKTLEPKQQPIGATADSPAAGAVTGTQSWGSDSTGIAEAAAISASPEIFEDAALSDILSHIAEVNGATVEYKRPETAQLHLYYKFDPALPLGETIGQLNTFEQIKIHIEGKKIIVD